MQVFMQNRRVQAVVKVILWHIFCSFNLFKLYEAAILGGRPKNVSEEDLSARFLGTAKSALTVL